MTLVDADAAFQPITTAAAWRGDELAQSSEWIYVLSPEQVAELELLGARLVDDDPDLRLVQASDYPLVACADALAEWGGDIDTGRGFVLVRGLRAHLYSDALSAAIYYLLALHLGEPMQLGSGNLISHIYAVSDLKLTDVGATSGRIRDALPFHSDSSDIVGLMCLRPAREGGASLIVSGATIYNEVLARRPDLVPLLFETYHWDWLRQGSTGARTYTSPLVDITDGVINVYGGFTYAVTAQEYEEVPRLRPEHYELFALFDEIANEPGMALPMDFRPGDIQWLSNYAVMHSRTEFVDWPEPQRRRDLLQMWVQRPGGRPVSPDFGKNAVIAPRAQAVPKDGEPTPGRLSSIRLVAVPIPE